jgi:hypothetical protein
LLVTLLVAAAVALLIVGAVMDGHENEQAQAERGAPGVMAGGPSPVQSVRSTP